MSWQQDRIDKITTLLEMVMANGTVGDIAEFGVFKGLSLQAIARTMATAKDEAIRSGWPPRRLHAFDSFQGLPKPVKGLDMESPLVVSGTWAEGKMAGMTGLECGEMLNGIIAGRFHVYQGFFKDTLPAVSRETIFALVHLDCDLYESTRDVLEHLTTNENLSDGCVLLFDDFFENRGSPKYGQRRAFEEWQKRYKPRVAFIGHYGRSSLACVVNNEED